MDIGQYLIRNMFNMNKIPFLFDFLTSFTYYFKKQKSIANNFSNYYFN